MFNFEIQMQNQSLLCRRVCALGFYKAGNFYVGGGDIIFSHRLTTEIFVKAKVLHKVNYVLYIKNDLFKKFNFSTR